MKNSSYLLLLVCFAMLLFASCGEDKNYLERSTIALSVSAPSSAGINEVLSVNLIASGSSGCSEFSRFTTEVVGDTTLVQLFQKRDQASQCSTALIEIEASIDLLFESPGSQFIKFNDGLESSEDGIDVIIHPITITP